MEISFATYCLQSRLVSSPMQEAPMEGSWVKDCERYERWRNAMFSACLQAARLPELSGDERHEKKPHRHSVIEVCDRNAMEEEEGIQVQLLVGGTARESFPEEFTLGLGLEL